MKTPLFLPVAALLLGGASLLGQVYTPPTPGAGGGAAPAGGGAPQSNQTTIVNQGGQQQGNQQVVGNDVPYFDPTTDVFTFDGKSFNVNDNRVFRARFENYLIRREGWSPH